MTMEFLIVALFAVSLLTNLTVEGIKKLLDKKSVDYSSNVMAAVTAVVISVALSAGYLIYTETMLNAKIGVELIALAYLSFLVATNGYDKVIQAAGSSVQCYGYYTTYNGTRWYYVVYGDKTGFCSSAHLQKA